MYIDCFVVSGSKVLEGVGKYVVVAVGQKSFNALRGDTENTPLQLKLNALAELIAKIGSATGLILFVALLIKFFVQLGIGEPIRSMMFHHVKILSRSKSALKSQLFFGSHRSISPPTFRSALSCLSLTDVPPSSIGTDDLAFDVMAA
ncbi:hypothetical protein C8J56DRAFT_885840 [Mycena floridula]|nr:hypothetical protein C8J56DRAFT_885840 [Mycena floridula]